MNHIKIMMLVLWNIVNIDYRLTEKKFLKMDILHCRFLKIDCKGKVKLSLYLSK
jgi:hypothetical protein